MGRGKFLRSLRQRWWILALLVIPVTVGVLLFASTQKAKFEAFVTVADKRDKEANLAPLFPDQAMFAVNELEIRVANLANTFGSYTVIKNAFDALTETGVLKDKSPEALREFANKVDIRPLRGSEYIQVGYESTDPDEAKQVITTLFEKFNTHFQNLTANQGKAQVAFIEAQFKEQQDLLNQKLMTMQNYQETHPVGIAYEQSATGLVSRRNQVAERLAGDQSTYAAAIGTLRTIEMQKRDPETVVVPTASIQQAPNPLWNSINERINATKTVIAGAAKTVGPEHPRMIQLQKSLEADQALLAQKNADGTPVIPQHIFVKNDQQMSPIEFDRLRSKSTAERARDGSYQSMLRNQAEMSQVNAAIAMLPAAQRGLMEMNSEISALSSSVTNLGMKLQESKVRSGQNTMRDAALLDAPQVKQLDPGVLLKTMIAFFLSLIVGVSLIASLGQFDQATYTPADAENSLGFPVLAALPKSSQQRLDPNAEAATPLAASYQLLSTQILMVKEKLQGPCILVASAEPNAGRSTVAANLAISLARDGARVVLIDGDLRSPGVHEHFGLQNRTGLSEILSGRAQLSETVQRTGVDGLLFIAAGSPPVNPVRLLRGEAMEGVVAELAKQADYVVFDSPAGSTFGDAAVLADHAQNIVLVHEAGRAASGAELEFHKSLERMGANVIGMVLNKTRPEDCPSYAHFRKNYESSVGRYDAGRPQLGSGDKPVARPSSQPPASSDDDE